MSKNQQRPPDFKPRIGVLFYGELSGDEKQDLNNQTYIPAEVRFSTDKDSFLAALNELASLVEIVAFFKGGSSWKNERLDAIVDAFALDASSIGAVYTDYQGVYNQSFSFRHLNDPDAIKGDLAISSVSLSEKQLQAPEAIDNKFFLSLLQAISASHISVHVPKVLGQWK